MGLQNWRWWQWGIISLIVGGLLGFALTSVEPTDATLPSVSFNQMRNRIERRTEAGDSIVTRIRVAPPLADGQGRVMQWVTYWERQRNKNTGSWDPVVQYRTETPVPLSDVGRKLTVMDFLSEKAKEIPSLDYKYKWWVDPKTVWTLALAGSVLVIGILWPILLKLMVKLGLAPPPEERMDLSSIRSTSSSPALSTGQAVTAEDSQKLADLNAEMEANVAGMTMGVTATAAAGQSAAGGPQIVRDLGGTGEPIVPGAAKAGEDPNDYKGEYYPVAKPHSPKENK